MSKSSMWSRMASGLAATLFAFGVQAAVDIPGPQLPPEGAAKAPPIIPVDAKCYSCHEDIEDFHTKGRHATVNCAHCHDNAAEHQAGQGQGLRRASEHQQGPSCLRHLPRRAVQLLRRNQYGIRGACRRPVSRAALPLFDKLMEGYGFTKEHNEPRSTLSCWLTSGLWTAPLAAACSSRTGPTSTRPNWPPMAPGM